MHRGLAWTLGVTVVLSIATLWIGEVPQIVSTIEPRLHDSVAKLDAAGDKSPSIAVPLTALPSELPVINVEPAKRDMFVPYMPPSPAVAPPPLPSAQPAALSWVAAPQAPVVNLRFLGSMTTPSGQHLIYLARGDASVSVSLGDRLDEGYVVTQIAPEGVTLTYPPLETRVIVPISQPPPP